VLFAFPSRSVQVCLEAAVVRQASKTNFHSQAAACRVCLEAGSGEALKSLKIAFHSQAAAFLEVEFEG